MRFHFILPICFHLAIILLLDVDNSVARKSKYTQVYLLDMRNKWTHLVHFKKFLLCDCPKWNATHAIVRKPQTSVPTTLGSSRRARNLATFASGCTKRSWQIMIKVRRKSTCRSVKRINQDAPIWRLIKCPTWDVSNGKPIWTFAPATRTAATMLDWWWNPKSNLDYSIHPITQ